MPSRQRGLTLIELMIAMTLTLVVVIAAGSALLVARRGFTTVDAVGQLQDNARFATDLIQRIAGQAGFLDAGFARETQTGAFAMVGVDTGPAPVQGYNDAINPTGFVAVNGSRSSGCPRSAATECSNGSDILILRAQSSQGFEGGTASDRTMIDCHGDAEPAAPGTRDDAIVSMFHVRVGNDGEPSLVCTAGTQAGAKGTAQPLVRGVESFQVLYGVDGVTPKAAPEAGSVTDSVPDRYLRADQMVVDGDDAATRKNWQR
ncbi:MAG: PilW family protein, partial [Variovorax sp.]